jgi:hypothetical protein
LAGIGVGLTTDYLQERNIPAGTKSPTCTAQDNNPYIPVIGQLVNTSIELVYQLLVQGIHDIRAIKLNVYHISISFNDQSCELHKSLHTLIQFKVLEIPQIPNV